MKLILAAALLLSSAISNALGRVVSYEEANTNLFGSIQELKKCGHWKRDSQLGEFRLIKLYYAGQDMLFVDMIAINENRTQYNVVFGFSFKEINNDHAEIGINSLSCEQLESNNIKITAKALDGHNNKYFTFELLIDGRKRSYVFRRVPSN